MTPTEPGYYWVKFCVNTNAKPWVVHLDALSISNLQHIYPANTFRFLDGPLVPPSERTELEHLRAILDRLEAKTS